MSGDGFRLWQNASWMLERFMKFRIACILLGNCDVYRVVGPGWDIRWDHCDFRPFTSSVRFCEMVLASILCSLVRARLSSGSHLQRLGWCLFTEIGTFILSHDDSVFADLPTLRISGKAAGKADMDFRADSTHG